MIKLKAMSAAHQVSKNISTTETTAPNKPVQGLKYRNDGLHPEMRKINVQETEKYIYRSGLNRLWKAGSMQALLIIIYILIYPFILRIIVYLLFV